MNDLVVLYPDTRVCERRYILDTVLRDFLGLKYNASPWNGKDVAISVLGTETASLILRDVLFQLPQELWLTEDSMPSQPLVSWKVSECLPEARTTSPEIPVIYGNRLQNGTFYREAENGLELGLDIFGSAFFMLTRYEEIVRSDRDSHDRFPAFASIAYQEGFLNRPIIDEYVEIFWACMKRLWPSLERTKQEYQVMLSHDVDHPLAVLGRPWPHVVKSAVGDVIKRRDMSLALRRLFARFECAFDQYDRDPFNTFGSIMTLSEKYGISSAFYFLTQHTGEDHIDGYYSIDMPWIRSLMRSIYDRGHEIGLHGSYHTYRNAVHIRKEYDRLRRATDEEGIKQSLWGSRQHYLRWRTPVTWRALTESGLDYDSTLTYADHVGFRCGVSREYRVYDLEASQVLQISERPLIVMDGSLIGPNYMNLSLREARYLISVLARNCRTVHGVFTLLCHNNTLASSHSRFFFEEIMQVL
jgi:peptidoglycan/xylan/chitin deacetylase (PgdA/CDA1 family)